MTKERKNKPRETKTKKEEVSTCRKYNSCDRIEKDQGRCNSRCCSSYKVVKK